MESVRRNSAFCLGVRIICLQYFNRNRIIKIICKCMYVCMYEGDCGGDWLGIGRIFSADVAMAPSLVHPEGLTEGVYECMYVW